MNRLMRLYPSPSLVVSMIALIVSLGGVGYSATGGNFILGKANSASTSTALSASLNGRALQLTNTNAGGGATALGLNVAVGHPPFAVNSSVRVANLNADRLDGLDSTQFPNRLVIPFNLAPGAITAQIVPPLNQPIFVMGGVTNTSGGNVNGVGQVTLLRGPNSTGFWWVGLESPVPSSITSGDTKTAGSHIVWIDYFHEVDIEVNGPNTIRVHNENTLFAKSGIVTLIW